MQLMLELNFYFDDLLKTLKPSKDSSKSTDRNKSKCNLAVMASLPHRLFATRYVNFHSNAQNHKQHNFFLCPKLKFLMLCGGTQLLPIPWRVQHTVYICSSFTLSRKSKDVQIPSKYFVSSADHCTIFVSICFSAICQTHVFMVCLFFCF